MIECHVERGGVRRGGGRTRGCEAVLGSEVRTRNPARWISAPLALCFISLCIFVKILSALSGDPLVIIHRGGNNRDAQAPRQYSSTLPQRPCSPRSPPTQKLRARRGRRIGGTSPLTTRCPSLTRSRPLPEPWSPRLGFGDNHSLGRDAGEG